MATGKPAGVILAGGRSSRMGVERKALLQLAEKTLLEHVIERLRPQVGPLLLSCESRTTAFDQFGLTIVPDLLPLYRGPLAGLYSALQHLEDSGTRNDLVLCPCDAPFIPAGLVTALLEAGRDDPRSAVAISYQDELQPTFSLWRNHHLDVLRESVVNRGQGGLKSVLRSLPHVEVEWPPAEPPPFHNVNTPQDLEVAQKWLDRE